MKKNGILTLLFACIPGAGQMYQGYMKRGLSLITMFCLFIILGSTTGLDALVVGCIVVYMYSFFDTLNLRAQLAAEKAPEDDYLVHFNWHDARMTQFMGESHKLVGWGLIALGAIVFYNNIIMRVLGDVMWRWGQDNPVFRAIYLMLDALPQIVVCVALIVCGTWLVRGPKNKKGKQPAEEEPEDFTPTRLRRRQRMQRMQRTPQTRTPILPCRSFRHCWGAGDRCRAGRDPCGG